jgi:bis(5'-nucleosidyl)-tetraphosphatase
MSGKNRERRKATSCGGIVWRSREGCIDLLLIQQFANNPRWGIPKGHQHPGESLEDCARREIKEETGVEVVLESRLMDVATTYRDEDKTVTSWLARPVGSEVPTHDDPNSEVADARWFPIDALPEIHVYQRPLIASAVETLTRTMRLLTEDDD